MKTAFRLLGGAFVLLLGLLTIFLGVAVACTLILFPIGMLMCSGGALWGAAGVRILKGVR